MKVEKSPERFRPVAINAEFLVFGGSQKHGLLPGRPEGRRGRMRLVTGQTGDCAGTRRFALLIEGRSVSRLVRMSAVEQGDVRVVQVFRNKRRRTFTLAVAAGAERPAKVILRG